MSEPAIHQFIFASPKPGMTERDFLDYWIKVHAVEYASKIPQIRKYLINSRLPFSGQTAQLCSGVAEIWLDDATSQLASLQSTQFINGARADEPNWAAFWSTFALDTTTHDLLVESPPTRDDQLVKLLVLAKRRTGLGLEEYRRRRLAAYSQAVLALPGLRRYQECFTRDSAYQVGEALFDSVSVLSFDDAAAVEAMWQSRQLAALRELEVSLIDLAHAHVLLTSETWVIGPEPRPVSPQSGTENSSGASTDDVRTVAGRWFGALGSGQIDVAISCLAPDVEFINYTVVPGYNDIMPWIGTYHGPDAVYQSFKVFTGVADVLKEELINLAVDGESAVGVVHERSRVKATGVEFEIEFIQWLTVRNGKIVRWKSYTDPSPILRAMKGG